MTWARFEQAAADAVARLGARRLGAVTGHIADGWPREAIIKADPDAVSLLDAVAKVETAPAVAYLRGIAAGYASGPPRPASRRYGAAPTPTESPSAPPPRS